VGGFGGWRGFKRMGEMESVKKMDLKKRDEMGLVIYGKLGMILVRKGRP
jgi:hypothetical protein